MIKNKNLYISIFLIFLSVLFTILIFTPPLSSLPLLTLDVILKFMLSPLGINSNPLPI